LFIGTRAGPAIDVAYPDRFFVCQSFSVFFLKKSFFNWILSRSVKIIFRQITFITWLNDVFYQQNVIYIDICPKISAVKTMMKIHVWIKDTFSNLNVIFSIAN